MTASVFSITRKFLPYSRTRPALLDENGQRTWGRVVTVQGSSHVSLKGQEPVYTCSVAAEAAGEGPIPVHWVSSLFLYPSSPLVPLVVSATIPGGERQVGLFLACELWLSVISQGTTAIREADGAQKLVDA